MASAALLMLTAAACRHQIEDVRKAAGLYEPAMEVARSVATYYSENGTITMKLFAPTVVRHQINEPYTEFPDGISMSFQDSAGAQISRLTSEYGIRFENDERTVFRDSVHFVSQEDEHLYTDELLWDEKNQTVSSDRFVRIVTPEEEIMGTGFEANQQFTYYRIRNISGTFKMKEQNAEQGY